MNRIFYAHIAVEQYLLIILVGAMAVYGLRGKDIPIAVLFTPLLVVGIKKLIHTTYIAAADNRLLLFFGHFSCEREILLKDITSVERTSSTRIGKLAVMCYALMRYGEDKCMALLPVKKEEFIRLLEQNML